MSDTPNRTNDEAERPTLTTQEENSEPIMDVAKPIMDVAEPVMNVAEPVMNVTEPVMNVAKPVMDVAEPVMDVAVVTDGNIQKVLSDTEQQNKKKGFDRGLQPDRIVTVSQTNGNLMFQVAWKNSNENESDLIEASVVYRKYPLLALEFFKNAFESSFKDETLLPITNE